MPEKFDPTKYQLRCQEIDRLFAELDDITSLGPMAVMGQVEVEVVTEDPADRY